jgi:hypothetical protein
MSDLAYIYLIQDGIDKGTEVYKIGMTIQKGGDARQLKRLRHYSKGTIPYNTWKVSQTMIRRIENSIKHTFKRRYRLVRGSEWFEGDVKAMKKDIDIIIEELDNTCEDYISHNVLDDVQDEIPHGHMCPKCEKVLCNGRYLKKHILKCTGIQNSRECPYCHRILHDSAAKCRHVQRCKAKMEHTDITSQHIGQQTNIDTQNITTQNNHNNSHNTTNNINNTVNVVAFKADDMQFITDHITQATLLQLLRLAGQDKVGMLEQYTRDLMINPENRCVEKSNMRSVHSKVYVGDDIWQTKHDKEVYPAIASNVASQLNDIFTEIAQKDNERRLLTEIEPFLDYMADKGYCNDEQMGPEVASDFRSLVQRLKGVIHDVTLRTKQTPV